MTETPRARLFDSGDIDVLVDGEWVPAEVDDLRTLAIEIDPSFGLGATASEVT